MNTDNRQQHKEHVHDNQSNAPSDKTSRHSARPIEVDSHGQRQRKRQYISERDAELRKIKTEYPDRVKHITYKQPSQSKAGLRMLAITVLIVFLLFSLSLLAVFGIAAAIKNAQNPTDTEAQTADTTKAPSTDSSIETNSPDTNTDTPPEPPSVYASATESTALLTSEIESSNAIMINLQDLTILAQKGSEERIYPASMTKIMTLLVGIENMQSLDQKATVTKQTYDYCYTEGASVVGFLANEEVTVKDLLYGTILPSGADATMTLAECIAGSEEAFVRLMNAKASELGLKNTNFVNTSGLHHPEHYSTVHDIAIILKAAISNTECFKILSCNFYTTSQTPEHTNGIPLYSIVHSRISSIKSNDFTIIGGKTGFTPEAGQCLATYAIDSKSNEYIFVSANAPNRSVPVSDAEFAYSTYIE